MEINNISQLSHEMCTGCGACQNICPAKAIKMVSDHEGFLCPEINFSECIECEKCSEVCPVLHKQEAVNQDSVPACYAVWSKDDTIRSESTSGGVFSHIAEEILRKGGAVAGAAYRSDHLVEHILIYSEDELPKLRQSKYVQSDTANVFRDVEKVLESGKPVLFSGTPCQCAALRAYLGKEFVNLYLCDFICRGVNSPMIYLAYLHELEDKFGSKIKRVWFKNKTFGWNNFATKIIFENGSEYIADRETDPFMLGYIKSRSTLFMRQSCYHCRFKGISRPVDLTLGDFWGVEKSHTEIDTQNGVSVVMIHSEKGMSLFRNIKNIVVSSAEIEDVKSNNACLENNVYIDLKKRLDIFTDIKSLKFSEVINQIYGGKL